MVRSASGPGIWMLGRWRFDENDASLTDGQIVRRLEFRAAATLAVLCRRRGDVVGRQELLDEVWNGRAVSPNSVAVVIADLRRALGDDAKAPSLLLTVAKRGYRLADEVEDRARFAWRPTATVLALVASFLLLAVVLVPRVGRSEVVASIEIGPVLNETGSPMNTPLATSLNALLVDQLARDRTSMVVPISASDQSATTPLSMSSRLVLWNGLPTLHMVVTRRATGEVVWSAMVVADADHIAGKTIGRMSELRAWLHAHPAGNR